MQFNVTECPLSESPKMMYYNCRTTIPALETRTYMGQHGLVCQKEEQRPKQSHRAVPDTGQQSRRRRVLGIREARWVKRVGRRERGRAE